MEVVCNKRNAMSINKISFYDHYFFSLLMQESNVHINIPLSPAKEFDPLYIDRKWRKHQNQKRSKILLKSIEYKFLFEGNV